MTKLSKYQGLFLLLSKRHKSYLQLIGGLRHYTTRERFEEHMGFNFQIMQPRFFKDLTTFNVSVRCQYILEIVIVQARIVLLMKWIHMFSFWHVVEHNNLRCVREGKSSKLKTCILDRGMSCHLFRIVSRSMIRKHIFAIALSFWGLESGFTLDVLFVRAFKFISGQVHNYRGR